MADEYATPTDLTDLALPAALLTTVPSGVITSALSAASSMARGYLASRYMLPLTAWGRDLTQAVCDIAAFTVMRYIGFNPDTDNEVAFKDSMDRAIRWLRDVSSGMVTPDGIATAPATSGGGRVTGTPARGW